MAKAKISVKSMTIESDGSPESAAVASRILGEFLKNVLTVDEAPVRETVELPPNRKKARG